MKKKSTKNKKVIDPFKLKLDSLVSCLNRAQSNWSFNHHRTYSQMAFHFGITINDKELASKNVEYEYITLFYNGLVKIIKDNYESKRYLKESNQVRGASEDTGSSNKEERMEIVESGCEAGQSNSYRDSIFVEKFTDQKATLLTQHSHGCNQVDAAKKAFDNIEILEHRGQLIQAQTGAGKTYVAGALLKNLIEHKIKERFECNSPWPYFFVTRATIVQQTEDVLRKLFNIDTINEVRVVNIEFLRTNFGTKLVKEQVAIVNGEESYEYVWNRNIHPFCIIWDECQALARAELSKQAKIAESFNDIERQTGHKVFQIFMSATPFSRVCEAKCFVVSTGIDFEYGAGTVKVNNDNWQQFARVTAAPAEPYEYCEAAIERLVTKMEPYIVRIKNIRPRHKTFNSVQRIHFLTKDEAEAYEKAIEEYQKDKARIEGDDSIANKAVAFLAIFTILRKKAEWLKAPHLAKFAYETWSSGQAPAIAAAFKGTILRCYKILHNDYGWNREDVSIIWGGATESLSKKNKMAKKIKENDILRQMLAEEDIDLDDMGIHLDNIVEKTEEDISFEKLHRLHTQKPEDREEERMRYQRQDSKLLIFTYKAGGVGLSAHHEITYPKARPRVGIFTPVYSEKEMIQAFGRLPRITSASDTYQLMCYYGNTIEEEVAAKVIMKLKCAKKVTSGGESWEDIINKKHKYNSKQIESAAVETIDLIEAQEQQALLGEYVEERK